MKDLILDVVLIILENCEIKDIYNISLANRLLYNICNNNKNIILKNILKVKGYKYGINNIIKYNNFLSKFYKIDGLLKNTDQNIIYSYELKYYCITKFLLENKPFKNCFKNYVATMTDFKIANLLSTKGCNLKVLIEVIRFTFTDKTNYLTDSDLIELKNLSDFKFNLLDNWKVNLISKLNKLTSGFELYNMDSTGYVISMMTKRWDFLIEDLNSHGKVWELLYFNCV